MTKLFYIIPFILVSFCSFGQTHDDFKVKISQVIKNEIFNGLWIDSWGKKVDVSNYITFQDDCLLDIKYSKASQDYYYYSEFLLDLTSEEPLQIGHSKLSSGVKIVFKSKIVTTISRNLRTQQERRIKEKVAMFYHRRRNTGGWDQNLIDVLIAYQKFCKNEIQ